MTALVTGLGLFPLAIGSGDPGREIEGPMAIVILGGLVTSTLLNLLGPACTLALHYGNSSVHPRIYLCFSTCHPERSEGPLPRSCLPPAPEAFPPKSIFANKKRRPLTAALSSSFLSLT